ncbi:hypothetical protein AAF712_007693 [Marasmius tenuissimus]|uniref:Uncharacterized protein n=1 Tax=Marasmius tenuissimus TaxID=585030 RepID=A0ABR2ZVA9_9AGAR
MAAKSDDEDRDTINDFTESEADQGSSPIDNNGGSESVYDDTDSVVEEVKPVKRNLRKRTIHVYISDSEDDFEQCDHDDAKVLTPDSLSCNNTNTEQEDIEVSAMFNSMVSVSERRSSSPIAVNDPLVVYNVFTGLVLPLARLQLQHERLRAGPGQSGSGKLAHQEPFYQSGSEPVLDRFSRYELLKKY